MLFEYKGDKRFDESIEKEVRFSTIWYDQSFLKEWTSQDPKVGTKLMKMIVLRNMIVMRLIN